jgi:hypothetical protein
VVGDQGGHPILHRGHPVCRPGAEHAEDPMNTPLQHPKSACLAGVGRTQPKAAAGVACARRSASLKKARGCASRTRQMAVPASASSGSNHFQFQPEYGTEASRSSFPWFCVVPFTGLEGSSAGRRRIFLLRGFVRENPGANQSSNLVPTPCAVGRLQHS